MRQEENQYLACPPEVARELPESLARLAGYQRGAYALGYYGDLRDPIEALHGESDAAPSFSARRVTEPAPARHRRLRIDRAGARGRAALPRRRRARARRSPPPIPIPAGVERVAQILGAIEHTGADGYAVIEHPDVDAVVNITPTRFHRDYIAAIASAGKPCFTEKPLAPTFDVVRDIVRIVRDAGIPVQVGFQSRFHPLDPPAARRWCETAEAGAPMAYTLRDDQFWPTGGVVAGHSSWRSDRAEAGGGALLEHSIHSCDILVLAVRPGRAGLRHDAQRCSATRWKTSPRSRSSTAAA